MGPCNRIERKVCTKKREGVSIVERREVHKFIDKQLRKGYIRLSKSP